MIGPFLILVGFAVLFVIVATDLDNCCRNGGRDAG